MVPCSRAAATSRSITCSPVSESSAPVGSSAKSTSRPATRPRASATRCACPPDSSPDRRCSRPSRPRRSNQAVALRSASRPADAAEQQRQRDVLRGGQLGDELAELEHEAEAVPAQAAALGLGHGVDPGPVEEDLAGVGHQDAGQAVQQRRLARAARAHDGEDLAGVHGDAGAAQRGGLAEARTRRSRASIAMVMAAPSSAGRPAGRRSSRSSAGPPRGGTGRGRRAARRRGCRCA